MKGHKFFCVTINENVMFRLKVISLVTVIRITHSSKVI